MKLINSIVGSWKDYVHISMKRKDAGSHIEWKFKKYKIASSERLLGKYLLFSSDESLPSAQVVKAYPDMDLVKKVFRTLKTTEEMEPVRHRLERGIRAYIFVYFLAYGLLANLQWHLEGISNRKDILKYIYIYLM